MGGRVVPGFRLRALDTTAAGDIFNGALAVALAEGNPLESAVRFANAAAAISFTRLGAQVSAPTRAEIYGVARFISGTTSWGTVFKLLPDNTLSNLFVFNGLNGYGPRGALLLGGDGNFYGTTQAGGSIGSGGVLCNISPDGAFTKLWDFNACQDSHSEGALVRGPDGDLFGTTYEGGGGNATIFQFTPPGQAADILEFDGSNGQYPLGRLLQRGDRLLYGTTSAGRSLGGSGSIFNLIPAGVATELAGFDGSLGAFPQAGLVADADGNLYGTTSGGGAYGAGTVFKLSKAGALRTLADFDTTNSGSHSLSPLAWGNDGDLYGTISSGGAGGWGTAFKVSPTGGLTTLVAFNGTNGATPQAGLIVGADGNLYGTTSGGGSFNFGTVYRMTPQGDLQTLCAFNNTNGAAPAAELVLGASGNFFRNTTTGGEELDSCGNES